jgi:hypothetical protein
MSFISNCTLVYIAFRHLANMQESRKNHGPLPARTISRVDGGGLMDPTSPVFEDWKRQKTNGDMAPVALESEYGVYDLVALLGLSV